VQLGFIDLDNLARRLPKHLLENVSFRELGKCIRGAINYPPPP